ncbi:alpha/beta fold hydrolase [Nakamurella sp. YIM 132087]|uniref:Alpha/beta fold hydrolase n=1 Tax=Nakamurella alba TaxID=2665158 RepID=A0A7K1FMT6_9ACTN|nr:alpha/beta hydrolase [Nakamurella alba]MTD15482.1 alpha/beta fold hydrolase [Nakamurella alba]
MLRYRTVVASGSGNTISVMVVGPETPTTKTPVWFVHPTNLRKEFWLDVIREIAVDRVCYAVDSAGHGESSDSVEYGVEAWVADHRDVILALGLDRLHLVGGSLGGAIIVGLAGELPEVVTGLASFGGCLFSTPAPPGETPALIAMMEDLGVEKAFEQVAVDATAPGTAPDILATVHHLTNRHGLDTIRALWGPTIASDASRWAPAVRCPALIVNGEFDATCTPAHGRLMADAVRGTFVEMAGVGHLPALEDPTGTLALLLPHLDAAEPGEAAA